MTYKIVSLGQHLLIFRWQFGLLEKFVQMFLKDRSQPFVNTIFNPEINNLCCLSRIYYHIFDRYLSLDDNESQALTSRLTEKKIKRKQCILQEVLTIQTHTTLKQWQEPHPLLVINNQICHPFW